MSFIDRKKLGDRGEYLAEDYLKQKGLHVVCRNFNCKQGEIDLICRDGKALVFVEVRYRSQTRHGSSVETVDWHKQQKIISAAQRYLQLQKLSESMPCRFDVIGIDSARADARSPSVVWIKDAFQVSP